MDLLVVLQTHSLGDSQHYLKMHDMKRYCGADKPEVMRRCTASLIESLNEAKETVKDINIRLKIFDDHSDEQSLQYLKTNILNARFEVDLEHLHTRGIMPSILKCYEYGKEHGKDWVYFVQDDYLYEPNAIRDMILAANEFSWNTNKPASIYPFNDPYKYIAENTVIQSHIVRSQKRHWKTHIHTASCFFTHKTILDNEWDLFEKMGKDTVHGEMEKESINRLFYERGYYLFVPIPSLALHMQYSTEEDPLYDWRPLWDKYSQSDEIKIDKTQNTVLNVGAGKSTIDNSIFVDGLTDLKEYRLDIDKKNNPDICLDVNDLTAIEDDSFNAVYCSHMVEHLDFFKVIPTIKNFLRITKASGEVRIIVPNLKSIAYEIYSGNLLNPVYDSPGGPISPVDILYGHRASVIRGSEFMRHKTGFTKESFEQMLAEAGIDNFEVKEFGFDLVVRLFKAEQAQARMVA